MSWPKENNICCLSCQSSIVIYAHDQSKYVVCQSCGVALKKIPYGYTKTNTKKKINDSPYIPIGSKGIIDNCLFLVTTFTVKKDLSYNNEWREYTLFNPIKGYCYLSEYDGHWMFAEKIHDISDVTFDSNDNTFYEGINYLFFNKYSFGIVSMQGEYHNDIFEKKKTVIFEYINPPYLLSLEASKKSYVWYKGRYLPPNEVQNIFGISALPQKRIGIGAAQPQRLGISFENSVKISIISALLILAIQLMHNNVCLDQIVYSKEFTVNEDKTIVTEPFELKGGTTNLKYELHSEVSNEWLETDVTLINDKTGEDLYFEQGVEFYYGYEGGEHWSEGSKNGSKIIHAVPEGMYHLNIQPVKASPYPTYNFSVKLTRDVSEWGNFWKALILLIIFPAIQHYRYNRFEKNRWMNSDYSPYEEY